jgi:two-component system, chemotaxis family, response regulator Rcp1
MTVDRPASAEILLVEDNLGDVRLVREVLRDSKLSLTLHHVPDGEEALAFLYRKDAYQTMSRPDLIMLDLNLPKKSGHEVLADIKANPDLRRIPVVVITSSQAEQDIAKTYDLQANCYVVKPIDFDQFAHVVRSIEQFWFMVVRLPDQE